MSEFDYLKFINNRYYAQQEYAEAAGTVGPMDEMTEETRYQKILEFLGHMMEEIHEARALIPRRSWKTREQSYLDNQDLFNAFVAEMYDILLFHAATLAYAGVDAEYFHKVLESKNNYNAQRQDHNKNVPDAIKELHGDCESSTLKVVCDNPEEEITGKSREALLNG